MGTNFTDVLALALWYHALLFYSHKISYSIFLEAQNIIELLPATLDYSSSSRISTRVHSSLAPRLQMTIILTVATNNKIFEDLGKYNYLCAPLDSWMFLTTFVEKIYMQSSHDFSFWTHKNLCMKHGTGRTNSAELNFFISNSIKIFAMKV